jgi:hypothetical protein
MATSCSHSVVALPAASLAHYRVGHLGAQRVGIRGHLQAEEGAALATWATVGAAGEGVPPTKASVRHSLSYYTPGLRLQQCTLLPVYLHS